ncbi:hypothetical protein Cabys_3868 [Caldithrix abyssi DSM 13497]|uniref:Uncharacterized protein n=1 Tax=Caldithrix abyssi DSM 13497 TaxID=880073 RepID=A0A1J1CD13_CALAY|nr:hypothetical protein Cabys_3868 [Caldithrix abyssi DSM 13497]
MATDMVIKKLTIKKSLFGDLCADYGREFLILNKPENKNE